MDYSKRALRYSQVLLFSLVLIACFFVWYLVSQSRSEELVVHFLNVGQGDSIFIESPNGVQVLVDGGPNKSVLREIGKFMPFWDRLINVVVATHPDADHVGGLPSVFDRFFVSSFIETDFPKENDLLEVLDKKIAKEGLIAEKAIAGTRLVLDTKRNIYLDILSPALNTKFKDGNDASVVIKLVFGETEFLLTGDVSKEVEKYLVYLYPKDLKSDVLKVAHHGSNTSSSKEFIGAVSPQYAVISSGKDNKYGHPDKETVEVLKEMKVKMLNTAEIGTISFYSDGLKMVNKK